MTTDFRADLHCHSTFSDGTDTPEQLIHLAIEKGLSGLSITDHDTISAYPEALEMARKLDFPLLPGIELSAAVQNEAVHILGYAFDLESIVLNQLCEKHKTRRADRNRRILEKLEKLGMTIDELELEQKRGSYGRPHIAYQLLQKGFVTTIQEAFDRYLGDGKPAYDPGISISVEETLETIKSAGGVAILAHPHLIKRSTTLREVLKMPFDGLEAYYARFGPSKEKRWLEIAQQKKWLATGGSDYHGSTKPYSMLGSSWVNKETFDALTTKAHERKEKA